MDGVTSVMPVKEGTMQIASRPVRIPSVPAGRRTRVAAVTCAAALAAGAIAFIGQPADEPAAITPRPAPAASSGGDDLSRYNGALLHHHGIRVARSTATLPPTSAQRRAADRFHHR
jgi:hypothetical protein